MGDAAYNAWAMQQHLARQATQAEAQRKATATTTADDTDDHIQRCLERARARTNARIEAHNNLLATSATARGPTATPLAADTTARDPHPIVVPLGEGTAIARVTPPASASAPWIWENGPIVGQIRGLWVFWRYKKVF